MNIANETVKIPTGYLFTREYSRGKLETLSIGDYGKRYNVKADFLGYKNPINGVPNADCMPLSEKWVVTVSTQYGCSMTCNFCDVPKVPFKGNATFQDLKDQFYNAIRMFPGVGYTERLNLHFARMGEPAMNRNVHEFAIWLYNSKANIFNDVGLRIETIHPVLTSSMPAKVPGMAQRIADWCKIKNEVYNGQAGLQISINSTNQRQRDEMFNGRAMTLLEISDLCAQLPDPISRKYCLNFAYSTDYEINAEVLVRLFDPNKFMVKITPIHNNNACTENGIRTDGGYETYAAYATAESDLIDAGFDVLVFVPSMDEEDGLVTCGNVILGGSVMKAEVDIHKIQGM